MLELALALLSEPEFADGPSSGVVLQAYLRDSEETLERILDWAREHPRPVPLTVRLVKGAYWDHEVMESAQHGWTPPVWTDKRESDRCYERLTRRLVDAFPLVRPAIASTTCARSRTRSSTPATAGSRPAISSCRSCAASVTSCSTRSPARGCGAAPTARSATWSRGWPTSSAACWRTRPNDSFLTSQAAGAEIEELMACP